MEGLRQKVWTWASIFLIVKVGKLFGLCCSLLGQGDNQIVLLTTGSRRQPDRVAHYWVKETTRSYCSLLGQGDNQIVLLTTGSRRQPDRVAHYWVKETIRSW